MLLKKFTELINLAPQFDAKFKSQLIEGFKSEKNAGKFELIAQMETLLKTKGLIK